MRAAKLEFCRFAVLILVLALGLLGWAASPLDAEGRPVLLLPDVKRIEDYRGKVRDWKSELRLLDGRLTTLLAGGGDLLSQSRDGQRAFEGSLRIAKQVDAEEAPATLEGLRSMAVDTSLAYLDASRGVLEWISAPRRENYEAAVGLVQSAREQLADLVDSPW